MSYLVLARKWRPQNFSDVVGQQPVVRTLQNALRRNRVAHAMLFSGVRGVGKTTLARLMAKAMNCQVGESDTPCNQCESCREITAGTAIDLREIDGASNRGIQEIRELKENIRFFPTKGRYKVVIIDEVHMLTTEAFNALLKTLEEPPAHVYFMFATTELHKIPVTILSRCQRYELKRVSFSQLIAFFEKIAVDEGVEISSHALELIAREAEGSVRDGLSLLDQIFSFGGEKVSDEDVIQVLGLVDRTVFENLAKALLAADLAQALKIFNNSYNAGIDLKRFVNDLLGYFRGLLVCKTTDDPAELLDVSDRELAVLVEIAAGCSRETLYYHFNLLLKAIEEMQYSTRPKMAMEMAFVRAVQGSQITPVQSLLERLDQLLESSASPLAEPQPGRVQVPAPVRNPEPVPADPEDRAFRNPEASPAEKKTAEIAPPAGDDEPSIAPAGRDVRRYWEEFLGYVKERKNWMSQMLRMSSGVREEGTELMVKFDEISDCKMLQESDNLKLLTEFAQDFFQHGWRVVIQVKGAAVGGDPAEAESPQEERRALAADPLVQMTTEIFSGQIAGIRTGPRSR
jgi:DNA polymerase-3 subunit gamma/tau